jgi:hypothetical protein
VKTSINFVTLSALPRFEIDSSILTRMILKDVENVDKKSKLEYISLK